MASMVVAFTSIREHSSFMLIPHPHIIAFIINIAIPSLLGWLIV